MSESNQETDEKKDANGAVAKQVVKSPNSGNNKKQDLVQTADAPPKVQNAQQQQEDDNQQTKQSDTNPDVMKYVHYHC